MKPRPVVIATRVTRADRYRLCPDEPALLREVGRDGGELLRKWRGRKIQNLKEESV